MTLRRQQKDSKKAGVQEPMQTVNFSYTETKRKPESCSCANPGPPKSKRKAHQNYRELSMAAGSRECTDNKYYRRPGEQGALLGCRGNAADNSHYSKRTQAPLDTKSSLDAAVHLRGLDPRKSVPPGRTCIQHVLLLTTAGARKQPNSSHGRVEAGDVLHTFMGCD